MLNDHSWSQGGGGSQQNDNMITYLGWGDYLDFNYMKALHFMKLDDEYQPII